VGPMTQLIKVSGDNQSGENGTLLPNALVVRAADQFGNAISGASVTFTVFSGGSGATVNPATAQTTPANGQVQVTAALGTTLGTYIYRATSGSFIADFTATALPSMATVLIQVGATSPALVFTSQTLTVQANDIRGNPVAGVTVTFAATSGGSGVGVNPLSATTDANGRASTTITLGQPVGTNRFTATASGPLAPAVPVLTVDVNGTVGPMTQLIKVSGDNQSGENGTSLPIPLVVRAADQFGNAISGASVTFTVFSGGSGATVNPPTAQTTPLNGQVQATAALGTTLGTYIYRATSGSFIADFTATALPSFATVLIQVGAASPAQVFTAQTLTVQANDVRGNPVAGVTVTFAATSGGTGVGVNPLSATTDANGRASTTITLGQSVGTNRFTATASGPLAPAVPVLPVDVNGTAGPLTQLIKVLGDNQSAENATQLPIPLVVRAADQYGNAINGASVTFTVFSGGTGASVNPSGAQTAPVSGQVQVAATLGTALGTYVYRAISGGVTADFTATALQSVATVLVRTSTNNAAQVATTQTFTVQALDVRGNPVPGLTVTFAATSGGTGVGVNPASATTDGTGMAGTTITLGQSVGTNRFTATAGGPLAPAAGIDGRR